MAIATGLENCLYVMCVWLCNMIVYDYIIWLCNNYNVYDWY